VREVLVVDDGSTDDTRSVLAGYGQHIRPIYENHSGASGARNRGIREAAGEWIAFLDDDDVWLPAKIERQIAAAKQTPAAGIVYCSDYAVDERLDILYERAAWPQNRGDVFDRLIVKNFIYTSCVIARRDAIQEAGNMDLGLRFAQDWDLWLKIAAGRPAECVFEPLVLYRQSASGCLTRDIKAEERLREMESVLSRAMGLRTVSAAVRRKAWFELERNWAAASLVDGRQWEAFRHALRTTGCRPSSPEGYRLLTYSLVPKRIRDWAKAILRPGN
jgi:glycosyltransferase involved in cell wall biosynthesis